MEKSVGKRIRDPLAETAHQIRYKAKSQKVQCFLKGTRSLAAPTPLHTYKRVLRAHHVSAVSHGFNCTPKKSPTIINSVVAETSPEYFRARRSAIYYEFLLYGAPDERFWKELNLVKNVMVNLNISSGNRCNVKKTLQDCLQAFRDGVEYNPNNCYANNGASAIIKDNDDIAKIIYDAISRY